MPVSKITLSVAMRARDVSRPRADQLSEAAERERERSGDRAGAPPPGPRAPVAPVAPGPSRADRADQAGAGRTRPEGPGTETGKSTAGTPAAEKATANKAGPVKPAPWPVPAPPPRRRRRRGR